MEIIKHKLNNLKYNLDKFTDNYYDPIDHHNLNLSNPIQ